MTSSSSSAGLHEFLLQDRVIWGTPAAEAVLAEADRRRAQRIFIVTSKTLNRSTDAVANIRQALGARHVATFDECVEHTPRASVIAAADAARAARPDLILTIGGGTAIDTVKVMLIALAHDLRNPDDLSHYHLRMNPDGSRFAPVIKAPPMRQIVLSTTLSAAEYSNFGGCTDPIRKVKDGYVGREIGAASVILDPAITVHTPEWLWLSTGIRAIDHAVEGICSIQPSPLVEATALQALKLFKLSLHLTQIDASDMAARLQCLQAAWLAGTGILRVPYGASHGMGHSLGAVTGMSHGYTSCVMLPHVMRWNLEHTQRQQRAIAEAMGRSDGDAAMAIAQLISQLKLPTRLRDLNVRKDQFAQIASGAIDNLWVRTNPRPITSTDDLMQLLEHAW